MQSWRDPSSFHPPRLIGDDVLNFWLRFLSCLFISFPRAQTNCDVFVLTKKDLDEVLTHYPQIRKKILETAEERQRMVAERAKAFAKKKEEDMKREEENKLKVCIWFSFFFHCTFCCKLFLGRGIRKTMIKWGL